jgi:hypothetical protein
MNWRSTPRLLSNAKKLSGKKRQVIDQAKRIREVFRGELDRIRLGDAVGFAVDGPCYVPSQQGIAVGWLILVTLRHNVLLGQPDIGVTVPVIGVLPPDDVFRKGAAVILEEARKLRNQANHPEHVDGAIQGQVIPPGLVGRNLAGAVG